MGKRSDFPRRAHDDYPTPPKAVMPLLPHLPPYTSFIEPCVGEGKLIRTLTDAGFRLVAFSDLPHDARYTKYRDDGTHFITNPPWTRDVLHPIIDNLRKQKPTWLLLDADWAYTCQAAPYLPLIGETRWTIRPRSGGRGKSLADLGGPRDRWEPRIHRRQYAPRKNCVAYQYALDGR